MSASLLTPGKKAWEQYIERNVVDPLLVREPVAHSWQRCRALRVSYNSMPERELVAAPVLERRLDEKERLIEAARPFMRDLNSMLSGSEFQVILTDETGLLLEASGDPHSLQQMREVQLCPGATWSEANKGTNAIGTALVEAGPVQISGWEHFREENHFLTCSAAPIFDADGRILGVLDVSGDCRFSHPHTLGMVTAVARAIENQLRLELARHEVHVLTRYSSVLMHGANEGLLAVNNLGIILDINARGGQILGVNPAAAKGAPLERIWMSNSPIVQVFQKGQEYENQPILIDRTGKQIRSSATAVRDESGNVVGAVAFFQEVAERQLSRRSLIFHTRRCSFDEIVGESHAMRAAKEWAALAAGCNSTVLLLGESGTGKEIFASAVHGASARSHAPFLAINCAAMPETLIESELFGYTDGSFTGAKRGGQAGKFELANGGTVFLDEIGEMSAAMQAKLLRVLQERTVQRVGSSQEIPVDIRIIAATHRDLGRDVEAGRFREDLYYRIAVLEVKIPPLRDRPEDIPVLARCLMRRISTRMERAPLEMADGCLEKLGTYAWPGNVREMENVLERAIVAKRRGDRLDAEDVDLPSGSPQRTQERVAAPTPEPARKPAVVRPLREVEREAIAEALSVCEGNIKQAAARLGIARNTLYRKMEEYELGPEELVH